MILHNIRKRICDFNTVIIKRFEKDPKIIVPIDGGFSSQMDRYLLGRYFSDKGFKVAYDIMWFYDCGMDLIGKESREWELLKSVSGIGFL